MSRLWLNVRVNNFNHVETLPLLARTEIMTLEVLLRKLTALRITNSSVEEAPDSSPISRREIGELSGATATELFSRNMAIWLCDRAVPAK